MRQVGKQLQLHFRFTDKSFLVDEQNEGSPFNVDSIDFIGAFGSGKEDE